MPTPAPSPAVDLISEAYPRISREHIEQRLRYATYVNPARNYLYVEVPKAACSTMKTLIHKLEKLPQVVPFKCTFRETSRAMFIHCRDNMGLPSLLDLPPDQQTHMLQSPDVMRFTIVRNPLTRLVSAWQDKVRLCAPGYAGWYERLRLQLPLAADIPLITFQEFVAEIAKSDLYTCNHHWRIQCQLAFLDAIPYTHIGRVESLGKTVERFVAHAGFSLPDPVEKLLHAQKNESHGTAEADEATVARIAKLYARDFLRLDYEIPTAALPPKPRRPIAPEKFDREIIDRNIIINDLYNQRDALLEDLANARRMVEQMQRASAGLQGAGDSLTPASSYASIANRSGVQIKVTSMPKLDATLHLDMLNTAVRAKQPEADGLYGLHWGDPEKLPELATVRDKWLKPYVNPGHAAIEIGPGGGRWTRYMLGFKTIFAVDLHQELLDELKKRFTPPNMRFIRNNGTDFPGIDTESIDFLFSFGVFVHLDVDIIQRYLVNMRPVLKRTATAVIQYSDKDKQAAKDNKSFSENNPRIMRKLLADAGYEIVEEDTSLLWHSSIVRFVPAGG